MTKSVKAEIERLREEFRRHNRLYFVEAKPEISDLEFDKLMKRLQHSRPSIRNSIRRTVPRSKSAGSRSKASTPSSIACRCCRSTTVYDEAALLEFDARIKKLVPTNTSNTRSSTRSTAWPCR